MKQQFIEKKFKPDSMSKITLINGILNEYAAQDFTLSLRQLYYQMVARGHIENSQRSYKNTGNLVSDARLAGLIDWDMIEDRGRETVIPPHWSSPSEIIRACADGYHIDKWEGQRFHVEVVVEKDALSGVLVPVCRTLDVGLTANKGYSSSSMMYEMSKRLKQADRARKKIVILYMGDHDPSGIDMTRDVRERLMLFTGLGSLMKVDRLALNMDQVEQWNPPENPAKETDARFDAYFQEFGESSWELDAIEPVELSRIVTEAVTALRDEDLWTTMVEREEEEREALSDMADDYEEEHRDD